MAVGSSPANTLYDFHAPMVGHRQRTAGSPAPSAYRGGIGVMQVQLGERTRVDIRPFSARHGSRHRAPSPRHDSGVWADAVSCAPYSPWQAVPSPGARAYRASG